MSAQWITAAFQAEKDTFSRLSGHMLTLYVTFFCSFVLELQKQMKHCFSLIPSKPVLHCGFSRTSRYIRSHCAHTLVSVLSNNNNLPKTKKQLYVADDFISDFKAEQCSWDLWWEAVCPSCTCSCLNICLLLNMDHTSQFKCIPDFSCMWTLAAPAVWSVVDKLSPHATLFIKRM